MKRLFYLLLFVCIAETALAQNDAYTKSIIAWQKKYTTTHEAVKGKDRQYFRFFPINPSYYVKATFQKINDTIGFDMRTSAGTEQHFFKYGLLKFTLLGTACKLYVYQSSELLTTEKFKNYLFIPFTDKTNGNESYGGGRYLEYYSNDIVNNILSIDFNGAYNPYCAYGSGYHCPIPPRENSLSVAVRAGEMNFGKKH